MPVIDPVKMSAEGGSGGGGVRECGAGRKVLFPIGHRYRTVNGNPVVDIRSVCIRDLSSDDGQDDGAIVTDTLWLTDRAMWRVARFAVAVGWSQPFDPEDPEDFDRVLLSGPFTATVKIRKKGEREYRDVENYETAAGFTRNDRTGEIDLTESQRRWVESAEKSWRALLASTSGGGYKSRDSGGRSSGNGSNRSYSDRGDIPF